MIKKILPYKVVLTPPYKQNFMDTFLRFLALVFFTTTTVFAQLSPGSTAPDFTITDIHGNEHNLYSILDEGKPVLLDLFAVWCGPCWSFAQSGAFEDFNATYGPEGNNTAFTIAVESDIYTDVSALSGSGRSVGDWTSIIDYPLADDADASIARAYGLRYYPTIYLIRPDRTMTNIGQRLPGGSTYWTVETLAEEVFGNSSPQSVEGCTDLNALNYNSAAIVDDGSCVYSISEQVLSLPEGWSIFSTYLSVENMDMADFLSPIVDDVTIVKNHKGMAYIPIWGYNGIGHLQVGQGYQIKLTDANEITIEGLYMKPEANPVELTVGWNTIGYLRLEGADAALVLEGINSSGNLILVKDYNGNVYLPDLNYNSIGDMLPGQGYRLKINNIDELQYLSNDESYRMSSVEVSENNMSHFPKVAATGNNMTVVIEDADWDVLPKDGSEIAAFDKAGNIIGSAIYSSPVTVLTVWGDDATTLSKDGLEVSEKVSFKVWTSGEVRDFRVKEWAEGSSSYKVDAINRVFSIEMYPVVADMGTSLVDRLLVKAVNILGQDVNLNTELSKREILFNVYDDGTVEKVLK
jgi:thiol-disulfide isomerase/thioredoxin